MAGIRLKKEMAGAATALIILFGASAWAPGQHSGHGAPEKARYAPAVEWLNLEEGRRVAAESRRPMVVDFAVPEGCSRCEFLQKNVYSRSAIVEKLNTDFVPVWIDLGGELTDDERALGEAYDFREDCLLLFLSHAGAIMKDPQGRGMCFADNVEAKVFIEYLDHVLRSYTP